MTVEILEPGPGSVVEAMASDLVSVVEVLAGAPAVVEVVSPGPDSGGGVVVWGSIVDKPAVFPPAEHTTDVITDFSTSVQALLDAHINAPEPHPAYDNISPSPKLLYENGLIG